MPTSKSARTDSSFQNRRFAYVAAAVVAALFNLLGILDLPQIGRFGYALDDHQKVTQLTPGGPAAAAGLAVGDHVATIDGHPADDREALRHLRAFARVGDARKLEIERAGVPLDLALEAGAWPRDLVTSAAATGFAGLLLIASTLAVFLRTLGRTSRVLALFGIAAGMAMVYPPQVESLPIQRLLDATSYFVTFLATGFFVHLALVFPRPRAAAQKLASLAAIYAPAVGVGLYYAGDLLLLTPTMPRGLSTGLYLIVQTGYLLAGLVLFLMSYFQAAPGERSRGLVVVVWGTLAAFAPFLVITLLLAIFPETIPGSWGIYSGLPIVLLPIALSYGVLLHEMPTRPASGADAASVTS